MATELLALDSREEVARFEELLGKYATAKTQSPIKHLSLIEAYDHLKARDDGGRIFSALLDIQVNFHLLYLDLHRVGAAWNQLSSKGMLAGGSALNSQARFFGKLEIHRFNSGYALRYRALWDKLMGVMILIYAPHEYESFMSAKSKKIRFQKLAEKHQFAEAQFLKKLDELLTRFDNAFPVPEFHGNEAQANYSFAMESLDHNPQTELIVFWNAVNGFISKFGKIIGKAPKSQSGSAVG